MKSGAGGVPSPCINVCRIHAGSGLCEGCLRTLDEITVWSRLGEEGKRAVWALLPARREAWLQQAGGPAPDPTPDPTPDPPYTPRPP